MIEIVPYRESWPEEFNSIAAEIRHGLGEVARRIDHIGSTAVPGLAAKDRIDIQVTVSGLDAAAEAAMESIGYRNWTEYGRDHAPPGFNGPDSEWEKWLFAAPDGQRPTNTHMRIEGRANQRYPLLFRDFLRLHRDTAEAYARLKRELAANLADPDTYPDVKDPAVDLIYLAAERWAADTDWEVGPSDA